MNKELIKKIDDLLSKNERVIVAIDGFCTAGKTTLSNKLKELYNANIFHCDDFFLKKNQKTEQREKEIGLN